MKKILLTAAIASAVTVSAFGQGEVAFTTGATASNRISTNSVANGAATGATAAVASQYYFALFVSTSQTSVNGTTAAISGTSAGYVFNNLGNGTPTGGWEFIGLGSSLASLGRFGPLSQGTSDASQAALNTDNSLTATGAGAAGSTANFVSIGWSANIGSTLSALEAWYAAPGVTGWIGQSAVGIGLTLGNGTSIPASSTMGSTTGQVPGYMLGIVSTPEPGTMALAAIGGASLLLFRRKK
jgi:hypothetical protein